MKRFSTLYPINTSNLALSCSTHYHHLLQVLFIMENLPGSNFLIHFVESLPPLPYVGTSNWHIVKAYLDEELSRTADAPYWINHAYIFGDLSDDNYKYLRDTLRQYRRSIDGLKSIFHCSPPEITARIIKFAVPTVRLDDFKRGPYLDPSIYCPQITILAQLSRKFRALVFSQPILFRTIHVRRLITCHRHSAIIGKQVARLLPLSGSLPLDVTVEFLSREVHSPPLPDTIPVSECSTMTLLRFKPWRSFSVLGYSYVVASIFNNSRSLHAPLQLTSVAVHFNRATSLDRFLEIFTNSGIPLYYVSISTVDSWAIPDLNHSYQLPPTVTTLRIRGSSRSVLFVLQAGTHVPSISVILVCGLDSRSGTWQVAGTAHTTQPALTRQQPIMLPLLTSFQVTDKDHWGHVGPDFLRWVRLPNLTVLTIVWDQCTMDLNAFYQLSLNQFFAQHPMILQVFLFDFPDVETLQHPSPNCVIRNTITRVPLTEWMELMHYHRDNDSDSEFSYTDSIATLSEASNGIVNECECSTHGYLQCVCRDDSFTLQPRVLPDTLWGESMEDYLG
ncbi:hypothetical protein VNI00_012328 [Paramarasmius palmivorus]|uniref:F-box domain-containing protein n=1 Tax=Paramarasmius palmivorus TaxID=297713 RepID=A0AAW0C7P2_9AGAR